ncbi:MAG: BNR repeat-containing protein [Mangrovibacterium sp.]
MSLISCGSKKNVEVNIGKGWSKNSVNVVKFRKNSLVTHGNYQFAAYYNNDAQVVVAKRKLNSSEWEVHNTNFTGNANDAHNCISIMTDGDGYLHLSWDHHNNTLHYARSLKPLDLEFGAMQPMTGKYEDAVTYPEFYKLANGNLIFCYRYGGSGRGNMVMNAYDTKMQQWQQLHDNLIDGEGNRNAYWQMCTDTKGNIHVSWTWRETWLVETNHDICYAMSPDGGKTWQKSTGEAYRLPITKQTAEIAWKVPQSSNLMNQTSMCADADGNPYIVNYWNADSITQYKVVYHKQGTWHIIDSNLRNEDFNLAGGGTKSIPISRPEILVDNHIHFIYRDEARGNKVSMATYHQKQQQWQVQDVSATSVGQWEPSIDSELWKTQQRLHIFMQQVSQIDGEGKNDTIQPTWVKVLEVNDMPN